MEKKKKPPYQVRMPEDLYEKAQSKAKKLGLSFASYVRMLVTIDTN